MGNDVNEAARTPGAKANKGLWARIVQFFREVIAEFKKVQRPTQAELWQLFTTVIFFVVVVMIFVALLDLAFGRGVFWIFG